MRIRIKAEFVLLLAMMAVSGSAAIAQQTTDKPKPRAELALSYDYLRSNAPPGGCTCFGLNGGSATFAWRVRPGGFAAVADVSVSHASNISSNGYDLTLGTYTAGARYTPKVGNFPLQPFGQLLVGVAHASGSLVEGRTPAVSDANAAFATNIGGGLDLHAGRHFSFRVLEADYVLTTFANGSNDHQNNLRLNAGLVLHF